MFNAGVQLVEGFAVLNCINVPQNCICGLVEFLSPNKPLMRVNLTVSSITGSLDGIWQRKFLENSKVSVQ